MCFVTFVPMSDGWVISSNRDESPLRQATDIVSEELNEEVSIYYPKDIAGGSWIAVSSKGSTRIILNGAFVKHVGGGKYRMSRGVMLRESFRYDSAISFIKEFDFLEIEPFTMIICEDSRLIEFVWDGSLRHINDKSMKECHAWSSCTLYDSDEQEARLKEWESQRDQLPKANWAAETLKNCQLIESPDFPFNSLKMDRDGIVATISLTQVIKNANLSMIHYDLISGETLRINDILN